MKPLSFILLLLSAVLWTACVDTPPDNGQEQQEQQEQQPQEQQQQDSETITVAFTEATTPLVNPERGFYGGAVDIFKASNPVTVSRAKAIRAEGMSLMYIGFYLNSFMKGDISKAYLDMIQQSMDALREAGIKCVLRFAYQNSESNKPWDPSVDIVLRHVEQLKPILQKNEDVIFVLQAGFVGVWGEWYYTTNFIFEPESDSDYEPRLRLANALLDALPTSRQIALRTPQFKMRMYNLSLKDTLTAAMAHDGSAISRLCGHNDCFGASADDYGTFDNEDNDREFWKADTRYMIMGGETCGLSQYCTCQASLQDMEDYHWTYLNSGYNGSVLNRWTSSGCMDEITDRLGYRLVLKDATCTGVFEAGKAVHIKINLENCGFAAPMNPRNAEIIFVAEGGETERFPLDADPRCWQPGFHTIEGDIKLLADKGSIYLALEDPLLGDRPEYSIACANDNVFDKATGWNKILEIQ